MKISYLVAIALFLAGSSIATAERPNVVLVMVDDMGFSDIGAYGGEIATPNLDRLASNGARFTQFYNAARCCPTRASLLTGLYPHQTGMGWMTAADMQRPAYRGELNNKCVTIAEALKRDGYRTYMSGKWHVTLVPNQEPDSPKESWPLQRGFDRYFGTLQGSSDFWDPGYLYRDNEAIELGGPYFTDAITDHAVGYINDHARDYASSPFFLYLAHTAPHWPMQAIEEDIAKYRRLYEAGWDRAREERARTQERIGLAALIPAEQVRDERVRAWKDVEDKRKTDLIERMAIYAAMIDRVDQGIGHVVDALKRNGQFENTLILFLSDNGGNWEGGIWGFNQTPDLPINSPGSNYSVGQSWANLNNVPFREYKSRTHEGGIATPLVVHWPAGNIDVGWNTQVGHVVDIMPTILEAAGAAYPEHYNGNPITPLEGVSLIDALQGTVSKRKSIIWEHEANRAIRVDDWKLVAKGIRGEWELYDLSKDRGEVDNLAKEMPEKAAELQALWTAEAERTDVLPLDGTNWFARLRKYAPEE